MARSTYPFGTTFKSKLCDVCKKSLQLAFGTLKDGSSKKIPHHVTKESLIESILLRSCHLCRFMIYHLKSHWGLHHRTGVQDLKEEPTTLTEDDFKDSDFHLESYPSDRLVILSYLLELPETLNFHAQVTEYGQGTDGVFGLLEFDCHDLHQDQSKSAVPRFWIFDEQAFGEKPTASRPNANTSADSSQLMLNEWLEQCSKHDTCSAQEPTFLPTRLLDLGDVDTNGQARLVLSENLDMRTRYVTLSHCWGGDVPFQLRADTELDTMKMMMRGFPVSEMPKTFRDAVAVARWADVRYIWIDSCCIIQNDAADWAKEAKTMRKVYQHTYFNISADHSENSDGGLFYDRLAYKYTPCAYNASNIGDVFVLPQFDLIHPLTESPIAERAWVIQERFLSPRILHFTTDQLFWECAGTYACETFPHGVPHVYDNSTSWHYRTPASLAQTAANDKPGAYEVWGRICQDYSRCKLSYLSDKLIAFAGIAGEFQSRFPDDTYLAGLWRGDLYSGLLWKATALDGWPTQPNGSHEHFADPYITAAEPETYRAPSWSWLGKDCGIAWQTLARHTPRALVEIVDAHVHLVDGNDCTADIRGGYIKLRGHLRAAQWSKTGHVECIILDGKSGDALLVPPEDASSPPKVDSFQIQRDTGMQFPAMDIVCLPVRLSVSKRKVSLDNPVIEGLILAPTSNDNEYKRLGYFEANGEGYCQALFYQLRALGNEVSQPWTELDLKPNAAGILKEGGGAMAGFDYKEELFALVPESVFYIV
ncbi:heterokaryon incompatibility protein-domain-containing protein [Ampelomyces quisqualis]|uniref:Heterokaryon incompatibility protein-domain-containing protein n=1 Tax=Ampelomyces quisqualis TaxID=50730 RepID=A0A6A5QS74_AMPQU|nr:heterokaryon incompatibility protein-domain-containing protein [Ampelomyces quisqualis]